MPSERVQRQIGLLLDEAEQAITDLDWNVVSDRVQAVLALDPDNPDAHAYEEAAQRAGVGPKSVPSTPLQEPVLETQPTSFARGRYTVEKLLGEGGKKRVYLAHDTSLDRDVALALIKTEGLDEESRTRVTREAQAMARLGDHPNVLHIHDLGEEGGQPYMVLPLMPGGDVEGLIESADDHRIPLERVLQIAQEVCRGLEFAHSKGIVHRDLKPGNVWLAADGTTRIGDFGLAVAVDRSRLTQQGTMAGTPSCMPPEQALGGEVTPQSDLYSLGAMLYEMATGRPPFVGDDYIAIIGQHINTTPVAPSFHCQSCPKPLEALILRLLAKNPSERPDSAADVLTALKGIDLAENVGTDSHAPGAEAHSLDTLAGGVFVGRQREMGDLKAALEDALSGRGRLVTLAGEPGIGKTRTAQELATYAVLRQAQVLWGRCYEGQGVPPYWPWVQTIRSYVRKHDPEQLRSEMGAGAADIAEIVPDVKEQLPDLEPAPALDPEAARFRLVDSITSFLKGASTSKPLVLVLDDLHWADESSLLLLQFLARELTGSRLLVIGTYRDVELSRRHPLAELLGDLTRERLFQRIPLGGLTQSDVRRFIELTSGMEPPRGLTETVYAETEGNPLFVTEVVRLLVQEGELTPERIKKEKSWTVRIPESVREVIGRRLNRLSERCNETLTIAAVIGREFELRQLQPLIEDLSEDRVLEILEEAQTARVIEEMPQAMGRYQFTHALIQETLADELSLTRRIRLHARIAEALEKLYGAASETPGHAAELAHHFSEAREVLGTERLVKYSLVAGQRALASYAWEEALTHFQRVLDAAGTDEIDADAGAALFGIGRAQSALAHIEDAILSYTKAFDYYLETNHVEKAVAIATSPLPIAAGRLSGALELCNRALELVDKTSLEAGRLFSNQSQVLGLHHGDYERSREALENALAIARQHGAKSVEMRTLGMASYVDLYHLRSSDALEKSALVEGLARDVDDPLSQAAAHYAASVLQTLAGDPESALQHAQAAVSPAERLRDRAWLARTHFASAVAYYATGDWGLAREYNDRAKAVLPYAPAFYIAAMLEYLVGNFKGGEVYLNRLVDGMNRVPPGPNLEHTCAAVAASEVALITGDTRWSRAALDAVAPVLGSRNVTPLLSAFTRIGLAILVARQEDASAASELYAALESFPRDWLFRSVPRVMRLLAHTIGKLDDAAAHFEESLGFCRKAGYRPELGLTCCDYAETLLKRDNSGDRERATVLLDESLQISRELGMRPLMERVLSHREILKA